MPPPSGFESPLPFISGIAPIAGMSYTSATRAPSTGLSWESRTSTWRTFSPAAMKTRCAPPIVRTSAEATFGYGAPGWSTSGTCQSAVPSRVRSA